MGYDRFDERSDDGRRHSWDPPRNLALITPDDSNDLPFVTTAFQVRVAGDLKVTLANGNVVTIPGAFLVVGLQYAAQIKRIWATGSAAGHTNVLVWGPD